jgi:hypothetical protein
LPLRYKGAIFVYKRYISLLVLLIIANSYGSGFKKYAGEFLNFGVGSRALALGGAYVAIANDVSAGYWNPAGLVDANGLQVQFMHAKQFVSSIQYDYFGISNQFNNGTTLAFSLIRLGVNDIKDTRNALRGETIAEGLDLSKITQFNTADYGFILSFSRKYNQHISYGANVKLIYRDFSSQSALGIGFDAGLKYLLSPRFSLGLMLRDITTTMMAWSTDEKEFIPPSIRPGASYKIDIGEKGIYIQPSLDFGFLFESRQEAAQLNLGPMSMDTFWGLEAGYKNTAFLRLGYDDLERFNGGLGVSINRLAVDYSYTNYDRELGNVHRISFHLKLNAL